MPCKVENDKCEQGAVVISERRTIGNLYIGEPPYRDINYDHKIDQHYIIYIYDFMIVINVPIWWFSDIKASDITTATHQNASVCFLATGK
jgi:hypothetical protein